MTGIKYKASYSVHVHLMYTVLGVCCSSLECRINLDKYYFFYILSFLITTYNVYLVLEDLIN